MHDGLYPVIYTGRPMRCTSCQALVDVIEIPEPWLDPERYVCGCCLEPVTEATRALAGAPEPPPPPRHLRSVA